MGERCSHERCSHERPRSPAKKSGERPRSPVSIERINPEALGKPSGFAHAVKAIGTSRIYLAGQTALDSDGAIKGTTIVEQFEQALTNLLTALTAAGGAPEHL